MAHGTSGCILSNGRRKSDELDRMWKEAAIA